MRRFHHALKTGRAIAECCNPNSATSPTSHNAASAGGTAGPTSTVGVSHGLEGLGRFPRKIT